MLPDPIDFATARGFVIAGEHPTPAGHTILSFWDGPRRLPFISWDELGPYTAIWPTKAAAMAAARSCGIARRRGVTAVPVQDAVRLAIRHLTAVQDRIRDDDRTRTGPATAALLDGLAVRIDRLAGWLR